MDEVLKIIFYVMTATMLITIILFLAASVFTLKSGTYYGELTRKNKIAMLAIPLIASVYCYFGAIEMSLQKVRGIAVMLGIIAYSLIWIKVSLENIYYHLTMQTPKSSDKGE